MLDTKLEQIQQFLSTSSIPSMTLETMEMNVRSMWPFAVLSIGCSVSPADTSDP